MTMSKIISQIFVLLLMIDSAYVAYRQARTAKESKVKSLLHNTWSYVCLYWIILTAKNLAEFIMSTM